MVPDKTELRTYLASPLPWFWYWPDGCQVVVWGDEVTITFRQELEIILHRLLPLGWPRFGAIVLMLGACRDSWSHATVARQFLDEFLGYFHAANDGYRLTLDVIGQLEQLHGLRGLVRSAEDKAELAAFVFERADDRLSPAESARLFQEFLEYGGELRATAPRELGYESLLADMRALRSGLAALDQQSLSSLLRTGLSAVVQPVPVDLPPGEATRALMESLADDEQLGTVLRLGRLMLASLSLPRPLYDFEELSFGGVADIATRGPLDRLLLSELAHDELTLAVRVAMNEALFLRREPLPRAKSRCRHVLLDSGLRMWGIPRVFGTAVGLALAAQADNGLEVRTHRASGGSLAQVDFRSREGVVQHLSALESGVHPGAALPALATAASAAGPEADIVIVTEAGTLADQEFLRALGEAKLEQVYIITVQRSGQVQIVRRTSRGQTVLRESRYDVDQVLAERSARKKSSRAPVQTSGALPAIFSASPFPLRVTAQVTLDNSWHVRNAGTLTLRRDGLLLLWDAPGFAARQLATGLPDGTIRWCSSVPIEDMVTLICGRMGPKGLYAVSLNVRTGTTCCHRLKLNGPNARAVFGHAGAIFVQYERHFDVHDAVTGECLATRAFPAPLLVQHRFVMSGSCANDAIWTAYGFNGTDITSEPVPMPKAAIGDPIYVVESPCLGSGPTVVTDRGELLSTDGTRREVVDVRARRYEVLNGSRDGLRLAMRRSSKAFGENFLVVEVATGKTSMGVDNVAQRLEEPLFRSITSRYQLRHRFSGIAKGRSPGQLLLISRKQQLVLLGFDARMRGIFLRDVAGPRYENGSIRPFQPYARPDNDDELAWWYAEWSDGSRAVLDARGLLHLQSSDRGILEATIVLVSGPTSGWIADGRCWGDKAFLLPEARLVDERQVDREVLTPFVGQLP